MGKFIIRTGETGFSFTLRARNSQVIGVSEVYTTRGNCLNGIESVRKNCRAAIEDTTVADTEPLPCPKFEIFFDKSNEFRFRLRARNGEIILASQGYTTKDNCLNGIESVGVNAPDAPVEDLPQ